MRLRGNPSALSCEELNGNASDAYSRQGIHLALIKFNITSSETIVYRFWDIQRRIMASRSFEATENGTIR